MRTIETGLFFLALASALSLGCGGSVSNGGGGSGGDTTTGSTAGAGGTGGTTGNGGTGGTTTGMPTDRVLAVHVLRLGDKDLNGTPSAVAWKQYGFNLDGKVSTKDSTDLCKPNSGAKPSSIYEDGDAGIDNSYGRNIMAIWTSLWPDFSADANADIQQGLHTMLIRIQGLGLSSNGTFPSQLFWGGFPEGVTPSWQGADAWPIRSDYLVNGDPSLPKTQFPGAKVTDDGTTRRWTSGSLGDVDFILHDLSGREMILPIRNARISMTLSADNAHAVSGMIGGIIDTELYINQLAQVAGSLDPTLCPPSTTFESIAQQIRQASDILTDGSQDPNKTCDAITIGLGFEADAALLGDVFTHESAPDPCQM